MKGRNNQCLAEQANAAGIPACDGAAEGIQNMHCKKPWNKTILLLKKTKFP